MNIQKVRNPALPRDEKELPNVLRLFFNRLVTAMNLTIDSVESNDASTLIFENLPTSDPLVAGQVWNDAGTLKVSAG